MSTRTRFAHGPFALACATLLGCSPSAPKPSEPSASTEAEAASPAASNSAVAEAVDHGKPLQFALDPVDRGIDPPPYSLQLRGKRAIVFVIATFDYGSLIQLRRLAPMLQSLPADVRCLVVARQPLNTRALVGKFVDDLEVPCERAIGDPERGRLGDLAPVTVVPSTLVLRADGTLAGAAPGEVSASALRAQLELAKR